MCTFNPGNKKPGSWGPKPTEKPSVVNSGEKGCDKNDGKHGHHGKKH